MPVPAHTHRRRSSLPMLAGAVVAAVLIVTVGTVVWAATSEPDTSLAASLEVSPSPSATASARPSPTPSPSPTTPEPDPTVEFTLVTAGDVLPHGPVLRSARAAGDGEYDFAPLMAGVRPYVQGADLALCHFEVPVAPAGTQPSGFPIFGAPVELVGALADEGWDGCSTASNHSVDRRFAGIEATLAAFDADGLGHSGTARTEQEAATTQMYTVKQGDREIQVANISFTYGLNGLPKPEGKPWAVDTFDANAQDVAPLLSAAEAARDQGADIVVASTHCCVEYQIEPNAAQRSIAQQIAESGLVDLYVGHHAHVPQPIELLDGGVDGNGMWTYFGHGNYLSNQGTQCCRADTNSGYLGVTTFTVSPDGAVDVAAQWVAITVDRLGGHAMHAVQDIMDTGAGKISATDAQARHGRVAGAVGDQAPELTTPPQALAESALPEVRSTPQPGSTD